LCRVLALAAPANQTLCRICGSKSRSQLYPHNHHASTNLGMPAFQRLPRKHKKLEKLWFNFGLLCVLFHLGNRLFRLYPRVCIFHCTCVVVNSRRSLYSTLFFRLLLGHLSSVNLAYKDM
jgi:hypothetical protein